MKAKEKTILFVMPRLPFPAISGRKTSLFHYCRILSEELGYRLVVAAFLESGDEEAKKPQFIDRLEVLPKPTVKEKMIGIVMNSLILREKPMQVSLYWSKKAKKIVDLIISEEKPDIIIGDMVRSTEYIKDVSAFRISDLDDRISIRYRRQLDADIDSINPYGAFLGTIPKFIRKIMLFKPIKLAVIKNEIELMNQYELEMGKVCEKTVFVAQKEADQFNKELGEKKALAIPIGVDVDTFSYRKTGKDGNIIGFLGAMSVAHNEHAIRHFIKDIFPYLVTKYPEVKLLVIGAGVSEELKKLSSTNIEFTGRVDNVREYLEKCKVFICPMTFGSGIKTKNLEAMSMGLPVVTTSIGAENINAQNGVEWIIADSNDEFAKAIQSLFDDEKKREEMGYRASVFIRNNFTWEITKERFEKLFMKF